MISKNSIVRKQYKNSQKMNFNKVLSDVLRTNEKEIVEINQGQMLMGEKGLGKIHKPHDDLFETGDFQSAMFMNISSNNVFINSTDWKSELLVEAQGKDIFDLNPENMTIAWDLITPIYNKQIYILLNK